MNRKSHFLCKHNGSLMESFSSVFTAIIICIILIFFLGWMKNLDRKDSANLVARKYLLQMESRGCLENSTGLISELQNVGLTNIDLTGTTTTQQNYGSSIYLTISGDLKIDSIGFDAAHFRLTNTGDSIPVSIQMSSTAKN